MADSVVLSYGACRLLVVLQIGLLLNFRPVFGSPAFCFSLSFSRLFQPEADGGVRSGSAGGFLGQRARQVTIHYQDAFSRRLSLSGLMLVSVPSPAAVKLLAEASACVQGLSPPLSASWAGPAGPLVRDCTCLASYNLRIPKIPKLVNSGIIGIRRVCVSYARSGCTDSESSKIRSISEFSEFGSCGHPPRTPSKCFEFPTFGAHCICHKRRRSVRVCELRSAQPCPNVLSEIG